MTKDGFNVMDHQMVPLHEVLGKKEVNTLLARIDATPEQLPRILVTDPAAIAVGAEPGQVLKITRESPTAGEAVSFRYVVEG